jgi:hypothetical protein
MIQGKTFSDFWDRDIAINGAYAMETEENMVDYFR